MSRATKNLEKWRKRHSIPTEVTWTEVKAILDKVGIRIEEKSGGSSHAVAQHNAMVGHPHYPEGKWDIPRKNSKVVKYYIKELMDIIEYIEEVEGTRYE